MFVCVQIREDLEKMEDRLEWANNALKSDWTRWKKVMRTDLQSAFMDTAEKNVNYYEKVRLMLLFSWFRHYKDDFLVFSLYK